MFIVDVIETADRSRSSTPLRRVSGSGGEARVDMGGRDRAGGLNLPRFTRERWWRIRGQARSMCQCSSAGRSCTVR